MSKPVAAAVAAGTADWQADLNGSLGYAKGNNITGWGPPSPATPRPGNAGPGHALEHLDRRVDLDGSERRLVGFPGYSPTHMYPQAILGSLAFDVRADLVLGFVDRRQRSQGGNRPVGHRPDRQPVLRDRVQRRHADRRPAGGWPAFTLECNGTVGRPDRCWRRPATTQGPAAASSSRLPEPSGQGPNHFENTEGGVVTYPGVPQAASTAMDPLNAIRVTGLQWFALDQRREASAGTTTPDDPLGPRDVSARRARWQPTGGAYFQKGGGIGAVALLTREPPVEIGNRVWLDADFNGRQDADEPAIQGAPVQLFAADEDGAPDRRTRSRRPRPTPPASTTSAATRSRASTRPPPRATRTRTSSSSAGAPARSP